MESDIRSERFIVNGQNLSYEQFFKEIALNFNKKPPVIKVSPAMSGLIWRLDWLKSKFTRSRQLITRETANLVSSSFFFNNAKSLEAFDFEYRPIDETLKATTKQFLEDQNTGEAFSALDL